MSIKKLTREATELLEILERTSGVYRRLDEIAVALHKKKFKRNDEIELIDNFSDHNTRFKSAAFRRFEVKRR